MSDNFPLRALHEVFSAIPDPRRRRGRRHPFPAILSLAFLGLVCRIREFATLQSWAAVHWELLQEPLGFNRRHPPHATTMSRALAQFSLADFQAAFGVWLLSLVDEEDLKVVAVDGKTACQGYEDGSPVHMLNVFAQRAKVVLAQWSVTGDKTNEPGERKLRLSSLLEDFPMIELLTGDAIFAQRPLAELLSGTTCDYLFQIKKNQGDMLDALETCFADRGEADAKEFDKKGVALKPVASGAIPRTPTTVETNCSSPTAASCSAWSVWSLSGGRKLFVM
ncbi:hypothetical protein Pla8534_23190 [Lignipirellula cremea]|uniref:H repeat-associated protein N-terminal domain-containing protein n=1 Tax=Lignipirellula cremea TaxID=2528010 RepID=A0A518DRQ8_9BACT|nr:hypothetical protein Pla8534_23190 [Lignipirellula cremea]